MRELREPILLQGIFQSVAAFLEAVLNLQTLVRPYMRCEVVGSALYFFQSIDHRGAQRSQLASALIEAFISVLD